MPKKNDKYETLTMRLYKLHDLDLISFIETHELNYRKAMYCALNAFVNGESFIIKIPPKRDKTIVIKKNYSFSLRLNKEKDKDAIELMHKIANGKKNNFLKNLLRLYLCNPLSEKFLIDEEDEAYFNEKFHIFREGKKIANLDSKKELNSFSKKAKDVKEDVNNISSSEFMEENGKKVILQEKIPEINKTNDTMEESFDKSFVESNVNDVNETIVDTDDKNEDIGESITDLFSSFL